MMDIFSLTRRDPRVAFNCCYCFIFSRWRVVFLWTHPPRKLQGDEHNKLMRSLSQNKHNVVGGKLDNYFWILQACQPTKQRDYITVITKKMRGGKNKKELQYRGGQKKYNGSLEENWPWDNDQPQTGHYLATGCFELRISAMDEQIDAEVRRFVPIGHRSAASPSFTPLGPAI